MVTLNPDDDFQTHVQQLLQTIADVEVRQILTVNISTLLAMSNDNKATVREPIVEALQSLIETRMTKEEAQ